MTNQPHSPVTADASELPRLIIKQWMVLIVTVTVETGHYTLTVIWVLLPGTRTTPYVPQPPFKTPLTRP